MMAVVRLRHQLTIEARIIRTRFFSKAVSATWRLSFYGPLSRYASSSKAAPFTIDKPKKWENVLLHHSCHIKCHFFKYAFLVTSTKSIINWNRCAGKQVWCTLRCHLESIKDGHGKWKIREKLQWRELGSRSSLETKALKEKECYKTPRTPSRIPSQKFYLIQ